MIYEINFLVLQSKTAELEKIRKESRKFIESYGAKIVEEKEYLKRKLAYEINHENYGFFTVLRFEFKSAKNLNELKTKLNQITDIARYIIIQAEGLPSLEEQDAKELEKVQSEKNSIKSEDVEKILTEQKKVETAKKEIKIEKKKASVATEEKAVIVEKVKEKEEAIEKKTKKKIATRKIKAVVEEKKVEKDKKTKENDKETEKKEIKEEVSLDELDKKLDEILNS